MAQTRRKRKSKHRGTPAGTIDRRGRTSKPPEPTKSKKKTSTGGARTGGGGTTSTRAASAAERREQRLNTPPTWRGALNRAAFAAAILAIFVAIAQKNPAAGVILGVFAMAIYVPMSYYTDRFLYNRRQRKRQAAGR